MTTLWPAKPHQTEPKLLEWAAAYPHLTQLDSVGQWSQQHSTYALTVTDRSVPEQGKRRCLIIVPHAHEPAGTVACMNYLSQLLEGRDLAGNPTALNREALLQGTLLTFIVDANPEGRSRAPEDWWDGSKYTHEEFLRFAFGIDEQGVQQRFKRVDRWRTTEDHPKLVGIAYERIDETTYVEPNRDWGSSLFRLLFLLTQRRRYDLLLDLHQTEFIGRPANATILHSVLWDELPENVRTVTRRVADAITAAWREMPGVDPEEPHVVGYTGAQKAFLAQCWRDINRTIPHVTVEVQNNTPRTPAELQRALSETAIRVGVEELLRQAEEGKGQ